MGAVGAGTVTAAFYNFSPELVARHIPRAWTLAEPARVLEARWRAVDAALRRLLGDDALRSDELAETSTLARRATEACRPEGRPLFAAHAELDWPRAPHLVLWHAVTLLREHRGDGHLAALLSHDLDGAEAIVSHTATGRGFVEEAARTLRGWSDEQWAAAADRLRERGVLDEAGALTTAGEDLRRGVEAATDRMAAAPWRHLGQAGTERIVEIGRPLSRLAVGRGAFPDGVFAGPR